ncbi:conserved hypothetical protein [Desulfamplus magnetovallimortis]|uniref:YkgJ family cysteine cluster protein n=1 Tax=Desulfamplus magnetovallimortis TaxID=1246637 RepID=A0A1W1HAC1_9BACT|nr:YkgJ family cysteine cluster protein [Desulfamplus magnetovallimortis]SLM29431.1 conserved hypothetical protein [Desulfamplus magnetovallimortis]
MDTDMRHAEEVLRALFMQIIESHVQKGLSRKGITELLTELIELAENIVKQVHESTSGSNIACKAGCSLCCHSRIRLTPVEALWIFSWIETNFSSDELKRLHNRIQSNIYLTHGKNLANRVKIKNRTPCIFLDHNKCMIYPVRPMICRSWHSFDLASCQKAFQTGNPDAEINASASNNFVFFLARDTLGRVCNSFGMECEAVEMPKAILHTLECHDPFDIWLKGETMFSSNKPLSSPDSVPENIPKVIISFMELHAPAFFRRFSLSYFMDGSCIEYFLYSQEKKVEISKELILSHDNFSHALNVSKFYPEIFREPLSKYMSAICFSLMIHHAAGIWGLKSDTFISLETRSNVFETFYSRLLDFDFTIKYRRQSDNYSLRGIYHLPSIKIDTSMITPVAIV